MPKTESYDTLNQYPYVQTSVSRGMLYI